MMIQRLQRRISLYVGYQRPVRIICVRYHVQFSASVFAELFGDASYTAGYKESPFARRNAKKRGEVWAALARNVLAELDSSVDWR